MLLPRRRSVERPRDLVTSASHSPVLSRALGVSAAVHAVAVIVVLLSLSPAHDREAELVDIELAPTPPEAEALPAAIAKPPEAQKPEHVEEAATQPPEPLHQQGIAADAGI